MQESIIALCLSLAAGYLIYTFIQKVRRTGAGCCGCAKGCGKNPQHVCATQGARFPQKIYPPRK